MAPGVRRAGHRERGRRRVPDRSRGGRLRRLGGVCVAATALLLVGWAVAPGRDQPEPPPAEPEPVAVKAVAMPVPRPTPTPTPEATPQIAPTGPGTFTVTPGQSSRAGTGDALTRYTVEVETGLPFDPIEVAAVVDATLADPRSWIADGEHAFERVASGADVRILIASPGTTDELCAPLRTRGEVSCRSGPLVVLNALRWAFAVPHYDGDVDAYRQYVVNHEVGHALGEGHVECPGPGQVAPVMLQQTYSLDGCLPNSWPYP